MLAERTLEPGLSENPKNSAGR